jgi:hypothetical protein
VSIKIGDIQQNLPGDPATHNHQDCIMRLPSGSVNGCIKRPKLKFQRIDHAINLKTDGVFFSIPIALHLNDIAIVFALKIQIVYVCRQS